MGKIYHHLNEQDRIFLRIMLDKDYSKTKIAKILNVHRSTIYREIKRNQCVHYYNQQTYYYNTAAHKKYLKRRKRLRKLEWNLELRSYVHKKLKAGWSPWQIEGRLKREGNTVITHETIYRYIYSDYGIRNCFYKKLRRRHFYRIKQNARRQNIPKELLIHERPADINERKDFGHWEGDLMIFKRGVKANLITLRERKSRYLVAIKNQNKTASGTALAMVSSLKDIKFHIDSITFDQGNEFKKYGWLKSCLETDIYFCEPASPHQKGGIENVNGVIRALLPRDIDFDNISQESIDKLVEEINSRPLKCLYYQTPQEVFDELISKASYENTLQ